VPLLGGDGSPSNTMSPVPRPTSIPSGICKMAVWCMWQSVGSNILNALVDNVIWVL